MRQTLPDAPRRLQYSLRALMIVTLIAAVFSGCTLALYRAGRSTAGYGPYASEADWPRALRALIKDAPSFRTGVTPYGLGDFLDHRSIWQMDRDAPLLGHMLSEINLEPADDRHPKSNELIRNVPYICPSVDWAKCAWYATPGYGARHIEGVDLFIIAVDEKSGRAIALHEWLF